MKQVNILLSAYNGEKYIGQQIDSLLNQSYPNCKIYIRDDGSTDDTINILKTYENNDNIYIEYGENVGFLGSFNILLRSSEVGDYWAFCDQDDVWYKDKIEKAVKWFEIETDNDIPLLYQCSYYLTDEGLNCMTVYKPWIKNYNFKRAITENIFSGFASVINKSLRKMMLRGDWTQIQYHDCWMTLIATSMGNFYFDEYIGAEHRRLQTSISEEKLYKRIMWGVESLFSESALKKRNKEFYREFNEEISEENIGIINLFVLKKNTIKAILKKVFCPSRWRTKLSSEIVIRMLMLFNRI